MTQNTSILEHVATLNRDQLAQLLTVAEALAADVLTEEERAYLQHDPQVGGPEWARFLADLRGRIEAAGRT